MNHSYKKPKPTLESLLKESQVITGKDQIKRKREKEREASLFQEAVEFEKKHRTSKLNKWQNRKSFCPPIFIVLWIVSEYQEAHLG